MPTSIHDVRVVFDKARTPQTNRVVVVGKPVNVPTPFPSLEDWRGWWIYFLLGDRSTNPSAPPRFAPFGGLQGECQSGTVTNGPARIVRVALQNMELQILKQRSGS